MTTPELVEVSARPTAVVRGTVPATDLPAFFDCAYSVLPAAVAGQGVTVTGPAFALYRGPLTATADLETGFPTDREVTPDGDVVAGALPACRVARVVHAGSFDGLGAAWQRLGEWVAGQGLRGGDVFWEVYLTEPSPDMDPADLRTELNMPVV
ncbi:GyrI-like domain-containing protein [Pseudonocardia alni]|uniref:Effector-binding domain-containing protein n=1 Tax=Pseudonocardia alni TaxID=33907 RepID=A0A852W5I5_PSEA5|nr:GyrI-like domain-containing protein [Pseudonocardia antarctica]NYG04377.1 effector-binding domain-containing protein [Pseudonocardia antarctica]